MSLRTVLLVKYGDILKISTANANYHVNPVTNTDSEKEVMQKDITIPDWSPEIYKSSLNWYVSFLGKKEKEWNKEKKM